MYKRRWWLYILKLENDKWYVGITSKTPDERFAEHKLGKRAAYWTMKHKPIAIERFEDLGVVTKQHAEEYENKITRSLIKERGLNNVRGGDLRDIDEYVRRFGRVYIKKDWQDLVYITAMFVLLVLFVVDKWFLPILPGGIR